MAAPEERLAEMYGELDGHFYHYTDLGSARAIIASRTIRANPFSGVNDPLEYRDWSEWLTVVGFGDFTDSDYWTAGQLIDLLQSRCKVICLTRDDIREPDRSWQELPVFRRGWAHPRMWDRYARRHTGVCLWFDREKLTAALSAGLEREGTVFHGDVVYSNDPTEARRMFTLDMADLRARTRSSRTF